MIALYILVGAVIGYIICGLLSCGQRSDMEQEIKSLRYELKMVQKILDDRDGVK